MPSTSVLRNEGGKKETIDGLISKARESVMAGDFGEALEYCNKMQEIFSSSARTAAWYHKGEIYGMQGKTEDAIVCYIQALENAPEHAEALYGMASELCRLGRLSDAIESYEKAANAVSSKLDYTKASEAYKAAGDLNASLFENKVWCMREDFKNAENTPHDMIRNAKSALSYAEKALSDYDVGADHYNKASEKKNDARKADIASGACEVLSNIMVVGDLLVKSYYNIVTPNFDEASDDLMLAARDCYDCAFHSQFASDGTREESREKMTYIFDALAKIL